MFIYRAWSWLSTGWAARSLVAVLIAWSGLLLTVPPKWWWGDQVNVHAMNHVQKFWVDDFVWLTVLTVALYATAFCAAQCPHATSNATPAPLAT